jgi:hypothetical protein
MKGERLSLSLSEKTWSEGLCLTAKISFLAIFLQCSDCKVDYRNRAQRSTSHKHRSCHHTHLYIATTYCSAMGTEEVQQITIRELKTRYDDATKKLQQVGTCIYLLNCLCVVVPPAAVTVPSLLAGAWHSHFWLYTPALPAADRITQAAN